MNKNIIISTIIIIPISIILFSKGGVENSTLEVCPAPNSRATVAICPTFYDRAEQLDKEKFELIKTNSSSESLNLLKRKEVDFVIAGRKLLPEEEYFESILIGEKDIYYSFLSLNNEQINVNDFDSYNFYTDIDLNLIKKDLGIDKVEKVDDIYKHLEKGITITSWENTDLNRAKIVHVLNNNGSRLELSRIPTLYYQSNCDKASIEEINSYSF